MSSKKGIGVLLSVGLGLGLLAITNTVSKIKGLTVKPLFIKRGKRTGYNQQMLLTLEITNPNQQATTLRGFIADVFILNTKLSAINLTTPVTLASSDKTIIQGIPFTLNFLDVLNVAKAFTNANLNKNIPIKIKGTLKADGFSLPVDTTFDVKENF